MIDAVYELGLFRVFEDYSRPSADLWSGPSFRYRCVGWGLIQLLNRAIRQTMLGADPVCPSSSRAYSPVDCDTHPDRSVIWDN